MLVAQSGYEGRPCLCGIRNHRPSKMWIMNKLDKVMRAMITRWTTGCLQKSAWEAFLQATCAVRICSLSLFLFSLSLSVDPVMRSHSLAEFGRAASEFTLAFTLYTYFCLLHASLEPRGSVYKIILVHPILLSCSFTSSSSSSSSSSTYLPPPLSVQVVNLVV